VSFCPPYHKKLLDLHFFVDTGTQVHQYLGYGIANALEVVGLWCIKAFGVKISRRIPIMATKKKAPAKKAAKKKKK